MKYIKGYHQLNEANRDIKSICREYGIKKWNINRDGSIDVDGDVNLQHCNLWKIPLRFGKVDGNFYCHGNELTSLEGCPKEVWGDFLCENNQLTSLKGGPEKVGSIYYCHDNKLTSFEGGPKIIYDIDCERNQLITLFGAPDEFENLWCEGNPVHAIWNLFQNKGDKFIFKINHIYTNLWMGDGWTLQGDILEQIADEIDITLPGDWQDGVEAAGYKII